MAPLASFHDIEHKAHPFDGRLLHFAKLNRKRHPLDDRPYGLWDSVHLLFWRSSGLRTARWDTTAAKRTPFLCSSAGKSLTPIIYSTCFHNTNATPTPPIVNFWLRPCLTSSWNIAYEIWQMSMPRTLDPNVTFRKPDTYQLPYPDSWLTKNILLKQTTPVLLLEILIHLHK